MSKTKLLVHLVFATGGRYLTLKDREKRKILYGYMYGFLTKKNCYVHAIGGIENHIHILFELHPSEALASLVKELKLSSNRYIRETNLYPQFWKWCSGYYAGSLSPAHQEECISYILHQEEHHGRVNFEDELKKLAAKYSFEYMEEDWM